MCFPGIVKLPTHHFLYLFLTGSYIGQLLILHKSFKIANAFICATSPRSFPPNLNQSTVPSPGQALNVPELRGRINSFSPPYSSHSQSAAGLIAAFAFGGYLAFRCLG